MKSNTVVLKYSVSNIIVLFTIWYIQIYTPFPRRQCVGTGLYRITVQTIYGCVRCLLLAVCFVCAVIASTLATLASVSVSVCIRSIDQCMPKPNCRYRYNGMFNFLIGICIVLCCAVLLHTINVM